MADDLKIVADYSDLQLMRRELVGISKDAKSSAAVFEREFSKVERQLVKQEKEFRRNVKASQSFYNELLGVSRATKSASASASVFERELDRVEKATIRATNAQSNFSNTSRKGMRRVEVIAQQAGYQFGDLAIQIQGGTNAAVAFGQQGSQLLGFFGPAGALAGAALAISTAFIAPLLNAKKEAKALRQEFEELIESIEKSNLLRGVGGQVALNISQTTKELIAVENRIRRSEEGVARRVKGREGTSYEEELKRLLEITKVQNKADYDKREALILQLRLLDAQEKAQKALSADQAQEAENLRKNTARINAEIAAEKERQRLLDVAGDEAILSARAKAEKDLASENAAYEREQNAIRQKELDELNDKVESMAERLAIPFAAALDLIRQAKAEATVDLDAFGGFGEFKYGTSSTFKPPKPKRVRTGGAKKADPLGDLKKQLNLEQELIGKSEEYIRVRQALGDTYKDTNAATISSLETQIVKINEAREAEEQRLQLMSTVESSLEEGFMSMIDGTKSVKDAFRDMAREIIAELYRVLVVKRMVSGITSFLGFADGGAFSGGSQIQAYADGGVVGGPTFFPMSGGKTGLMGEAGPEAIMPLKRGANGKLGVQMEGGGGDNITVNQSFNFSANGDDSVKRIIAQAAPQIANMTQKQIMDSRRRGGAMKSTFG